MADSKELTPDEMNMVIEANKMTYTKAMNSSLINTRQMREYNFSPQTYLAGSGSGSAEIVLNSGSDYIYGPGSYLRFTVQAVTTDGISAPAGPCQFGINGQSIGNSAVNLFRTATVTHRSGDQVDRVTNLNVLAPALLSWANDGEYSEKYVQSLGGRVADGTWDNLITPTTYCVPLWLISGLFAQEALLPGNLMGGMKLSLEFDGIGNILSANNGGVFCRITNMTCVLDSFQPFDSVVSSLNEAQANVKGQGLQYNFYGYHNVSKNESTSDFNFDVAFSAGNVSQLLLKTRASAVIGDDTADSLGAEQYLYENVQARLGSLTFPRHLLTAAAESYVQSNKSFDSHPVLDLIDCKKSSVGVSYSDYIASNKGVGIVAWDMEKNQVLKGTSGELTNNSRLLNVQGRWSGAAAARKVDIWVKHMRVVNVMMDNVVVDR